MNKEASLVVSKGDYVIVFTQSRKLIMDETIEVIHAPGATRDELKKIYPQASLRAYSDSRLSNRYRASVDVALNNFSSEKGVQECDATNP